MINKKGEKGITLIMIIIMVVIMLILVSVTTYTGLNTYKTAKITKFVAQMQIIQKKVDEICEQHKGAELITYIENIGSIPESTEFPATEIRSIMGEAYYNQHIEYLIYLNSESFETLAIEEIEDRIVVNFATREVINITGVEDENGNRKYTQYDLPGRTKINRLYSSNSKFGLQV